MIIGIIAIALWALSFYLKHFNVSRPDSSIKSGIEQSSKALGLTVATQAIPFIAFLSNVCACFATSGLNQFGFQWILVIMPWLIVLDYGSDSYRHQKDIKSMIKNNDIKNRPQAVLSTLTPLLNASTWFAIGLITSLIVLQIIF